MPIKNLTKEELNWLDVVVDNGVVISASITTADVVTPPVVEQPKNINMVCFGDSNTYGLNLQESEKYATLLKLNPIINTYNEGISGNTSANLLSRIQSSVFNKKDSTKRNILTVLIWTNDYGYWLTVPQVWDNIKNIVSQSKAQWWEVILMTYPPSDAIKYNDNIRTVNSYIMSNSTILGYKSIDINALFITPENNNVNKAELCNTQLHIRPIWHKLIADEIFKSLNLPTMFNIWVISVPTPSASPFGWNVSLQTNIQNYWKCNVNGSFPDELGANNGTINGATFSATGKIAWDYNYDNISWNVAITALPSWTKSISVWAKKNATGAFGRILWNIAGTKYLFQLYNDGKNYSNIGVSVNFAQTDDTNYHHYIVTTDGTNARFYLDSVLKLTTAFSWDLSWFDRIGKYSSTVNTATLWNGHIDEIGTWTKTLTSQDVVDLFNGGAGLSY